MSHISIKSQYSVTSGNYLRRVIVNAKFLRLSLYHHIMSMHGCIMLLMIYISNEPASTQSFQSTDRYCRCVTPPTGIIGGQRRLPPSAHAGWGMTRAWHSYAYILLLCDIYVIAQISLVQLRLQSGFCFQN